MIDTLRRFFSKRIQKVVSWLLWRNRALRSRKEKILMSPIPQPQLDYDEKISRTSNNPDDFCVISFGTRDGEYDKLLEELRNSCNKCGIQFNGETIPATKKINAYLFKPSFIKFKLLTKGKPVMWVDADSLIVDKIRLPGDYWDIGTVENNIESRRKIDPKLSLCVVFRPTIPALRFLETWEFLCNSYWMSRWMEQPGDHTRFSWTRHMQKEGQYTEKDITEYVSGKIIRDAGKEKEFRI